MRLRAAVRCSLRIKSTVALNELAGVNPIDPFMFERPIDKLRFRGVSGGENEGGVGPQGADQGVLMPGVGTELGARELRASVAAFSRRFVVPNAFVDPERAEQTTAIL